MRRTGLALLWIAGLWPLALLAVYQAEPSASVRLQAAAEAWVGSLAIATAAAALLLALVYPPFPTGVRFFASRTIGRLRADRLPYERAQGELRNFETAARRLEAGRAALAANDPAAAMPHLERSIVLEGDQPAALYLLGTALLELGRPKAAVSPLERAVELDPDHAFGSAMLMLGRALMLTGEPRRAAELLQRHAREHGGNRRSHYWLGTCLRAIGEADAAKQAFGVAAAPPPERPRLTAEEAWYRARARTALWGRGGSS